jgi:hypothetical protein
MLNIRNAVSGATGVIALSRLRKQRDMQAAVAPLFASRQWIRGQLSYNVLA